MKLRPRPLTIGTTASTMPTLPPADPVPVTGRFETVLVDGAPMRAFPIGRHAALAARPARVTVCVPVFNGGPSLLRCLQSISAQDYQDIDIIVIDNGSTDSTIVEACAAAMQHPRLVIYENAQNVGRVGNWNQCLHVARGEFVKLVMVNDVLAPSCLRLLVDAMDTNPGAVLARSSLTLLQPGGKSQFLPLFDRSCLIPGADAIRYCVERGNIAAGPTAQLLRRSAIASRELRFKTALSWAADWEFAVRLFESGALAYVREPLFVFDATAQRHSATRQPVAELREELAIRLLTVARNPALFPSVDPVIMKCAELYQESLAQFVTDAATRAELLAVFEQANAALAPSQSVVAKATSAVASATRAENASRGDDHRRFLQLPTTPVIDAGVTRRVCIVSNGISGLSRGGGAAHWVAQLAETLVAAGHVVTVLLARWYPPDDGTLDEWVGEYRRRGITLQMLDCKPAVHFHGPLHVIANREVYEWLKQARTFDVVHFNAFEGLGHYSLLSKRQGLAFHDTLLSVTVHSPHLYVKQVMQQYVTSVTDIELDFVERRSVELADVIISPSEFMLDWMRSQEWVLPAQCVVQQSLVAPTGGMVRAPSRVPQSITEIVFVCALQDLAGIVMCCDALEKLSSQRHTGVRVTFLGTDGAIDDSSARDYINRRCGSWTLPVTVVSERGQKGVNAYMAGLGCLAVMSSPCANSSHEMMDCIEHGIPFLASRVGGVPELIHPEDVDRVCYDRTPTSLASRLALALREGVEPARHRISRAERVSSWLDFHQTIPARRGRQSPPVRPDPSALPLVTMCITHFNRAGLLEQAVASVAAQDYPNLELVIVDDGSTDPTALASLASIESRAARENRPWRVIRQANRYLGAARNTGVQHARGDFVAFLDDDDVAKPHRISTQVTAAMRTGADIVLAGIDQFTGMDAPTDDQVPAGTWIALGPCVSVGTLHNSFGAVHAMVRRSSFLALGGFREVVKVTHEDWEFWARAVHAGQRLELVPEALNWYRMTPGSMLKTTSQYRNDMLSLQPHLDAVPRGMRPLIQLALGSFRQNLSHELERSKLSARISRKVMNGARLLAANQEDGAARCLVDAVNDAAAFNDTGTYIETLCDVGALLAGTEGHRDSGLALLTEAARLAERIGHTRGLEMADGLLQTMRSVCWSTR